jgi:acetone carboxylase gamma subunit
MAEYDVHEIAQLVDGGLPWARVQEIMKAPKDPDRFDKWVEILQGRVPWSEKILLPLTPHLFLVQKGRERIVKCDCGHEFGDYRVNWKLHSSIHVRDSEDALREVYRGREQPDPTWVQIREYYCPGCAAQLEVEAVPRGCPPDFDFLPDLDTFYRDWLGRPLPDDKEFADKTLDVIRQWSR